MTDEATRSALELTTEIVSAYVSKNSVPVNNLPNLIGDVYTALQNVGHPIQQQEEPKPVPAISVRRSITPDYLISLEDGKHYKSLKRHLTGLGLTPEAYREKWSLPRDYPMVAPSYAAKRSELAKSMGLGQRRSRAGQPNVAANDSVKNAFGKAPTKRGRKKAA